MKPLLLLAFLLLFADPCRSQPDIAWARCYGGSRSESAYALQQTLDGGYIVAGKALSTDGDVTGLHDEYDYWIVKLGPTGTIMWTRTLGGRYDDIPAAIRQAPDSSYIIAGSTASRDGDVTGNHGSTDAWIVRLSSTGDVIWKKCYGGSGLDRAKSVDLTPEGNYMVAGLTSSNDGDVSGNHGGLDLWVFELDTSGALIRQKCFGGTENEGGDYNYFDGNAQIRRAAGGGYILATNTSSGDGDVRGNHGNGDEWVLKVSAGLSMEWQRCLGGSQTEGVSMVYDGLLDVVQAADGGYLVSGWTNSNDSDVAGNHGNYDGWLAKLDAAGALQWQRCYGGAAEDKLYAIGNTSDGGYIAAGRTRSRNGDAVPGSHGDTDYWILKLRADGSIEWQECLGDYGSEVAYAVVQSSDGGYVLAGSAGSNTGQVTGNHPGGQLDFWVVKLGSQLSLPSAQSASTPLLYPNPCSDYVQLYNPLAVAVSVTARAVDGRLMLATRAEPLSRSVLSLAGWPPGYYDFEIGSYPSATHTKVRKR